MDDDVEERFTERARTRLADTLSEAARMLTAEPPEDAPSPLDRPGRGFDDILLARPVAGPSGPAPSEEEGPASEIQELRSGLAKLRDDVADLRRRTLAAEARAEEHAVALEELRQAVDRVGRPEPASSEAGRAAVSLIDPVLTYVPVPSAPDAPHAPEGTSSSAVPKEPPPPAAVDEAYTWAFTAPARRRFRRRREPRW